MGEYQVIDADAHYLEALPAIADYVDEPWRSRLTSEGETEGDAPANIFPASTGDRAVYGRIQRPDLSWPDNTTAEDVTTMMDHLGVDATVLLSQVMLTFARIGAADERPIVLANGYTDYMLEEVVDPDAGIYTMIPVPYDDPEASVELIRRAGDEPGIVGACMVSAGAEPPLGHRRYDVIYEACEELGLPVVFHAGGAGLDEFHIKGYEKFIETHVLGFLQANQAQLTSLVVQGVPEKFPDLDIVFQESGIFWVPLMMHRLDAEYMKRQSEAPLLTKRPSKYIKEFYFGIQPMELPEDEGYLEHVIEMIGGPDRLMYASDYPHWDYDLPDVIRDRAFLSEAEKRRILAGTATEVFGL